MLIVNIVKDHINIGSPMYLFYVKLQSLCFFMQKIKWIGRDIGDIEIGWDIGDKMIHINTQRECVFLNIYKSV